MTTTTHRARQPRGLSTGGQFAPQHRGEVDFTLSEDPAPVKVRDARGMNVAVTPGVLDENAEHLYLNGQCLALATALAEDNGNWGVAVRLYDDGALVAHAWAVDTDGTLHDVRGAHDEQAIAEELDEDEEIVHYLPSMVPLVHAELAEAIGPQDLGLAQSFVPAWHIRRDEDTVDAALWQAGRELGEDVRDEELARHLKNVRAALEEYGQSQDAADVAASALGSISRPRGQVDYARESDSLYDGAWVLVRGMDGR